MTVWSPEERAEIDRIEAGDPSPPDPRLRYYLRDCFACGFVSVQRVGADAPTRCDSCGLPVATLLVGAYVWRRALGDVEQVIVDAVRDRRAYPGTWIPQGSWRVHPKPGPEDPLALDPYSPLSAQTWPG